MLNDNTGSGTSKQELEEFRARQEEMLRISRESSRDRLSVWAEETRSLGESWAAFSREWQGDLEAMSARAGDNFARIGAQGEEAANLLSQRWSKSLGDISGDLEDWGENFLQTLAKVAAGWMGALGGGASGGWSAFLGPALEFGGLFHQGGMVTAHQGLGAIQSDEQLILAQSGEGILPREAMTILGEKNFEALRTGRFELSPGGAGPRYDITIQVQSLDAAGVAGLDWDRLVQRHLLPALQKEADRRW